MPFRTLIWGQRRTREVTLWLNATVPFGTARADRETGEHGDEAVESAGHSWSPSSAFPLIGAHDRIFGPHRHRVVSCVPIIVMIMFTT